jgi:acetylornithine deacetylase/succinyl-diaminopimelate desuccinylase-like protein
MSDHRALALQYAHEHKEAFLSSLKELVSIPSVSTDPERAGDIRKAADWVAARLKNLGMNNVQIFPTGRHPVVYGEWLEVKGAPTVLIYGHYDVQPVDPIDLWKTGPFEPTIVGDNLFGRGASDMKGQDCAAFSAVESIVKTGKFPINIKWMIEGEEEIGSPNLGTFIAEHKDLLKCDFALNPDSGLINVDHPSITYGLRGLAYFEVRVQGPAGDLHSGTFGGAVHNPAIVLAELIAGMHDKKGRITLPGFYDQVRNLSEQERAELARSPVTDDDLKRMTGVPEVYGEEGFSSAERTGACPTLDVNGMLSGFTGEGQKTVLPAKAMAKISMRLVPDQDPNEVHRSLIAYLEKNAPKTVRWEVEKFAAGAASISDLNNPGVVAMSKALEAVWNKKSLFKREGGSIPVVSQMQKLLGVESVIAGFGLPDDNLHAPNEKQHLPTWYRGIDAFINFFFNLA